METLDEKLKRAIDRIDGFNEWLEQARGSRIFSYSARGIKRDIIAFDYDAYDRVAGVILQEPGTIPLVGQTAPGVITLYNAIGPREVKIYVSKLHRRTPIEKRWELPDLAEERIHEFLASVGTPDIVLGGGLHISTDSSPNYVPFVLVGKDLAGNVKTAKFRYQEYLEPSDY
jgi:hypothetical protein